MPDNNSIFQNGANQGNVEDTKKMSRGEISRVVFYETEYLEGFTNHVVYMIDEGVIEMIWLREGGTISREGHGVTFAYIKGEVKLGCPIVKRIEIGLTKETVRGRGNFEE